MWKAPEPALDEDRVLDSDPGTGDDCPGSFYRFRIVQKRFVVK